MPQPAASLSSTLPLVLSDGGQAYAETDLSRVVVEPWNAVTAAIFVAVALRQWRRLGRIHEPSLFLRASALILLVGGVGGTLYHGFRVWRGFLVMDVLPILILIVAGSVRLWNEALRHPSKTALLFGTILGLGLPIFWLLDGERIGTSLAYVLVAALLIIPAVWLAAKERAREGWLVALSIGAFAAAITFRVLDSERLLPMGTHFLWHLLGALATWAVMEWFATREERGTPSTVRSAPR